MNVGEKYEKEEFKGHVLTFFLGKGGSFICGL